MRGIRDRPSTGLSCRVLFPLKGRAQQERCFGYIPSRSEPPSPTSSFSHLSSNSPNDHLLFSIQRSMSISSAAKQIVLVVGAGPGLGFSVARKFAEQGHPVALLSRSKDRLESLASQINALSGQHGKAVAYAVDVQDEASVNSTVQQIQEHFASGKAGAEHQGAVIHTGVFNPGGGFVRASFLETKPSQVEDAFRTQV